jgi:uncharacterized protein (DUF2147 family)
MRLLLCLLLVSTTAYSQLSIIGKWKTIDDNSGKERSLVEIFKKGNSVFGKITHIYLQPGEDPNPVCEECDKEDDRYNKKIVGMEIIRNMKIVDNELTGGNILDPENGKIYRCKIWVEGNNLKVRGYLGPFYRTQTWLPAR